MNRFMFRIAELLFVWGLQAPVLFAQPAPLLIYKVESGSKLWLEGTATVGDYTCEAKRITGIGKLQIDAVKNPTPLTSDAARSEVRISIPIKNFECGNERMNTDMYNAMKADSFPFIEYELVEANLSPSSASDSVRILQTKGRLTIAGITKIIPMLITIRQLPSARFRVTGWKKLLMSDFGITPPTALWGLIKADEQLVVRFDLIARQE